MGGREMKHYKYTNKNELPVPKYKEGQKVWSRSFLWLDKYSVEQTLIRKVLPPRWVDCGDTPHWVVEYRHQLKWNERMAQCPINEEELYDTEEEALKAKFELFCKNTFDRLEIFKKRFKAFGVECPDIKLIEQ